MNDRLSCLVYFCLATSNLRLFIPNSAYVIKFSINSYYKISRFSGEAQYTIHLKIINLPVSNLYLCCFIHFKLEKLQAYARRSYRCNCMGHYISCHPCGCRKHSGMVCSRNTAISGGYDYAGNSFIQKRIQVDWLEKPWLSAYFFFINAHYSQRNDDRSRRGCYQQPDFTYQRMLSYCCFFGKCSNRIAKIQRAGFFWGSDVLQRDIIYLLGWLVWYGKPWLSSGNSFPFYSYWWMGFGNYFHQKAEYPEPEYFFKFILSVYFRRNCTALFCFFIFRILQFRKLEHYKYFSDDLSCCIRFGCRFFCFSLCTYEGFACSGFYSGVCQYNYFNISKLAHPWWKNFSKIHHCGSFYYCRSFYHQL